MEDFEVGGASGARGHFQGVLVHIGVPCDLRRKETMWRTADMAFRVLQIDRWMDCSIWFLMLTILAYDMDNVIIVGWLD